MGTIALNVATATFIILKFLLLVLNDYNFYEIVTEHYNAERIRVKFYAMFVIMP